MMVLKQLHHIVKTKPLFLLLFPLFFIWHGFIENYESIHFIELLPLTALYLLCTIAIVGLFQLFYSDFKKAALMTFALLFFQFFFGNILDMLKHSFHESLFSRYRFILPCVSLFFLILFIWIKKTKKSFSTLVSYLNMLLLLLIVVETGLLVFKLFSATKNEASNPQLAKLTVCDTCNKPDIYLIIPDQYAGKTALQNVFWFDNSAFENELTRRGFHIVKESSSNYNLTPFSIGSILNMQYLSVRKGPQNYKTVNYSYNKIRNSLVPQYLLASGYQFYNCSIFDFKEHPAHKYVDFLPYGVKLITAQTFTSRLADDFRSEIVSGKWGLTSLQKKLIYKHLHFNENIFNLTVNIASQKSTAPKFVYTHLMMPHYPYYYDSQGQVASIAKLTVSKKENVHGYLEYLQYTNQRLLALIDQILARSPKPPIIVLLSDHGFRNPEIKTDLKYDFTNLNALYFPDKNYNLFYDSVSTVNEFRILLNTYFKQQLPLLKDSTINLKD